jgi:hypothetical protein
MGKNESTDGSLHPKWTTVNVCKRKRIVHKRFKKKEHRTRSMGSTTAAAASTFSKLGDWPTVSAICCKRGLNSELMTFLAHEANTRIFWSNSKPSFRSQRLNKSERKNVEETARGPIVLFSLEEPFLLLRVGGRISGFCPEVLGGDGGGRPLARTDEDSFWLADMDKLLFSTGLFGDG